MAPASTNPMPVLEVKTAKGNQLIILAEILYLKADNKHTIVYLINFNCVSTNHQLRWYEEKLPEHLFCRCHNSYIVNCFYIDCTCGNRAVLKVNNASVPISRDKMQYYKDNLALFKQNQAFQLLQNNVIHSHISTVTPKWC
jgi:two-component system LytT family response regulator